MPPLLPMLSLDSLVKPKNNLLKHFLSWKKSNLKMSIPPPIHHVRIHLLPFGKINYRKRSNKIVCKELMNLISNMLEKASTHDGKNRRNIG